MEALLKRGGAAPRALSSVLAAVIVAASCGDDSGIALSTDAPQGGTSASTTTADPPEASSAPPSESSGPLWRHIITSYGTPGPPLVKALTADEYHELWPDASSVVTPIPEIDFDSYVALIVRHRDNGCVPRIGLEIAGSTATVVTEDLRRDCDSTILGPVSTLTIAREIIGEDGLEVVLPQEESLEGAEFVLQLEPIKNSTPPVLVVPPIDPPGALLGTSKLPNPGESTSTVLDNGMPVWITHHADGDITVLPAAANSLPPSQPVLNGASYLVYHAPDQDVFVSQMIWDGYGRALTGGRYWDLPRLAHRVVGDAIVEILEGNDSPIPGEPIVPDEILSSLERPTLPVVTDDLNSGGGWVYHEGGIIASAGRVQFCVYDSSGAVLEFPSSCATPLAPVSDQITQGSRAQPMIDYLLGPTLLELDELGTIVTLVSNGGAAKAA